MSAVPEERATYSVAQAAKILGLSLASAYRGVEAGEIPCVRIGSRRLVPRAALNKLLAAGAEAV